MKKIILSIAILFSICLTGNAQGLNVLFLGDDGHHKPKERFDILKPALQDAGISLSYTDQLSDLNADNLGKFDALIIYANHTSIEREQADALLAYVNDGGGFVPLHCASACFGNSRSVVALIGGRFQKHGTGVFTTQSASVEHPILKDYRSFSSWDETYVHSNHNETDRTVLEYRSGVPQAEGRKREPWTWVRTHGKGRVFYTAWGHDERTWEKRGFQNLVERGIRWTCGQGPELINVAQKKNKNQLPAPGKLRTDLKPFEYVDVGPKIPNYPAGKAWGVQNKPLTLMQKAAPSDQSMKHIVVPEGFHVELFADESMFESKPIAMTWDHRGRLWVCETLDYPNELKPGNKGRDRIRIVSDTDGDGKADKSVIFVEGLSIPTSIAFHRGGAVVQNGTETLYLKDTDGDDKADVRKVLMSNWKLGDTHGGVSNFRNGLDNWIWAMQGYNDSAVVINGEQQRSFRMGFFRFKLSQDDNPKVEQLEFIRSTTNNTWGLGISEEGLIFGSTANGAPSFFMPIPNRYYERVRGWAPKTLQGISAPEFNPITDKVRQVDWHGKYTAAAGHALYTARQYPKAFWNRTAFVCGPTGKLVGLFELKARGAGYRSSSPMNLFASDDEWTAPIMAEVGPDGNVWVLDWYNYVVQHNPTPQGFETGKGYAYESDLRDKKHGRVYRVLHDEAPGMDFEVGRLTNLMTLVNQLESPTMLLRLHAQRMLVEQGDKSYIPNLVALVNDRSVDGAGLNVGAIHAMHVLDGMHVIDDAEVFRSVAAAMSHRSDGVRLNAVRVLPDDENGVAAIQNSMILEDKNQQVVLAALLKLSDMPNANAGELLATTSKSPRIENDDILLDAFTSAAAIHGVGFLSSVSQTRGVSEKMKLVCARVSEHIARSEPEGESISALLKSLGRSRTKGLSESIVQGLVTGWPQDYTVGLSRNGEQDLRRVFKNLDDSGKLSLAKLANAWSSKALKREIESALKALERQVSSDDASVEERLAAATQLVQFDAYRSETVDVLLDNIGPSASVELSLGIVEAVASSKVSDVGKRLAELSAKATPKLREATVRVLLSRDDLANELLTSIESGTLRVSDLSLGQQAVLRSFPADAVKNRAIKLLDSAGAKISSNRSELLDSKKALAELTGDAAAGKAIFSKNCANCHVFKGEGNIVGPNLNGMSVHPKVELLTHILDPNASVEGNYRNYTVLTIDGLVLNGLLSGETQTTIEIVNSEGKKRIILREDIEALKASEKSAMPEGFEQSIDDDGLVNLLEYLTQHERFIPLGIESVANITTTQGLFYQRENQRERFVFKEWGTKMVDDVPFSLIDPKGTSVPNGIMLHGPQGTYPPKLPKSVIVRCGAAVQKIHMLGGVGGWSAQAEGENGVCMIVRLQYQDGKTEDHNLIDGQHMADYIRRCDVPKSKFALETESGGQLRYLAIEPKRKEVIEAIELVKPQHPSAPVVMALTIELGDEH